jgi:hypothetical protein
MGVLITVLTVDSDMLQDKKLVDWVADAEAEIPEGIQSSRWPTIHELKNVIEGFKDYGVDYKVVHNELWIDIWDKRYVPISPHDTSGQTMYVPAYTGNDDIPLQFHFDKLTHEKITISVLKKLANFCGTFLILYDGESPTFVTSDMKL